MQAVVHYDELYPGPANLIGALRNPSCVSGLLNVTLLEEDSLVTLAVFPAKSAVAFIAEVSTSWTSITNCVVTNTSPLCTFTTQVLSDGDYFLAVIYDQSSAKSVDSDGYLTATFQGLTSGELKCTVLTVCLACGCVASHPAT